MNKRKKNLKRTSLNATFAIFHFFVLLGTATLCCICMMVVSKLNIALHNSAPLIHWLVFAIISVPLGTSLSAFLMRRPLRPFDQLLAALGRISKGDYSVRLNLRGSHMLKELNNGFNHMAQELGSLEMLRTDFVNSFSHEFKTPIVSISGFAKILQRENLTPEERAEYLDIIIRESDRLSELATNVLSLTKIENQHILTDTTTVNISEQIRLTAALLASRWEQKKIEIQFDADEVYVNGNEDMLKQVWLNLIDNAIKFSPEYGTVKISIQRDQMETIVTVANEGALDEAVLPRIFDKFFQGNPSHAEQGNGLGLTIAQKITELHGGTLRAESAAGGCILFHAALPGLHEK